MLLGLGPGDHFLKGRTFFGFPAGDAGIYVDLLQDNIIVFGIISKNTLLGIRGEFLLIVGAYPNISKSGSELFGWRHSIILLIHVYAC